MAVVMTIVRPWYASFMLRRTALVAVIALLFGGGMYTTIGCAPGTYSPSEPITPPTTVGGHVYNDVTSALVVNRSDAIRLTQDKETFTGSIAVDGSWFFGGLEPGIATTITVTTAGYQTLTKRVTLVQGANQLDLRLQPAL